MILCVMRIPPALDGHGGSQRAWRLVEALRPHGKVHFVLVYRQSDKDAMTTSLMPLSAIADSVTSIDIPEWHPTTRRQMFSIPRIASGWGDLVRMRCNEAPIFSRATLARIAAQLPIRDPDLIFAGRLPCAVMLQSLIDAGLVANARKVVDFDDIMSRFRRRQLRVDGARMGRQGRLLARIDAPMIERAERRIAAAWDGVSVCTQEDVSALRAAHPGTHVVKVPNVIDRPALPPREPDGTTRLLFVGNLSFYPNTQALHLFVTQALPRVRAQVRDVSLTVVGLHPGDDVARWSREYGFALHADVPSVQPYYAASDIVLAPILFGSGTRIKILEAMAYGRAVVSTTLGAEGLDCEPGRHLIIADTMPAFADAIIALADDGGPRQRMADAARAFVQRQYGVAELYRTVDELVHGAASPRPGAAPKSRVAETAAASP
jgi:hypothetical protein